MHTHAYTLACTHTSLCRRPAQARCARKWFNHPRALFSMRWWVHCALTLYSGEQAPSQIEAFNLVNGWYTANVSDRHAAPDTSQGQRCSGTVSVASLLQLIDLTQIPAVSFRSVVIPSKLVPEQMIMSVLLARAVDLEQVCLT